MIQGIHAIMYTTKADELRAFFRDVFGWTSVDAGQGWLIFRLPPAEIAAHPAEGGTRCELYLMCGLYAYAQHARPSGSVNFRRISSPASARSAA